MSVKSKIRQYLERHLEVPEIPLALERLKRAGFQPIQIFDVGAYQGDFARCCLQIWPQSKVACFEPLEHKLVQLKKLAAGNPAIQVFPGLLGASNCERVPLNEAETASSVLVEQIPQNFPVKFYSMRTVDEIVREHFGDRPPDLLKLDVQGYELEVLKGAEKSLENIQVILAEINFLDIHQNVPLLGDIVTWLAQRNWVAYDICGLHRRPLDKTLWCADLIFVPEKSSFRADKRWQA